MKYLVVITMNDGTVYYRGLQTVASTSPDSVGLNPFNSIKTCRSERNILQTFINNLKISVPFYDKKSFTWYRDFEIVDGTGHMMKDVKSVEIGEFALTLKTTYPN